MIYFQIHSIIHMVEVARTNQFRIYFDSHQLVWNLLVLSL